MYFYDHICSESSDKICWVIEEEGKDLPISEELRNTVKKLRSLAESELGKIHFNLKPDVPINAQNIICKKFISEKCKLILHRNP